MELARLDEEEQGERLKRRQWALHAVEEEQRRMIAEEFLLAFANRKQWYSDTLSSFCEDYQIMCPNSSLGCTTSCLRKDLDRHLSLECRFGPGAPEATNSEGMDESTLHYEVVCPYAVMGCLVVCPRRDIAKHLARCPFSGPRREEEKEERTRCLNMVLEAMEEERARRVQLEASGDWRSDQASCRSRAFLNTLFERQTRRGLGLLSEELSDFVAQCHADEVKRGPALEEAMTSIASVVQRLWPSACVLPYGSVASGLMTAESDIDLVVCPGEENSPYLRVDQLGTTLSESLPQFTVLKVLQHARIPIIKARWAAPDGQVFRMDLSLEVPGHTGLATTAFVTYLVDHMPRLKPLVLVLKHLLQYHNLSDPYKGGLSSYALTIMAAYLLLGGGAKVGGCPRPRPSPRRPPPQVPRPHGWQRQWDRANQQQWLGARTARAILMQDAFAQALPILLSQPHLQQADGNDCLNVESSKNILSSTEEGDEKDEGGSEPYPSTPSYASLATHAGTEREKPLGDLFIDFLRLFGTDFDVENEGFSIRGGGFRFCLRPQNATPHPCMGDPIVIEDPLDPTNNPGRCSFAISRVQQCFSEVLTTIMEGMVRLDVERQEGREKKLMNSGLLHRVISGPSAY
jgi:DNA polymerase sigma